MVNNRSWSGPRALLTGEQAAEIYMIGQAFKESRLEPLQGGRSVQTAKKYGISPKAIRDIWNRRTWQNETRHLWAKNEMPLIRYKKLELLSGQSVLFPTVQTRGALVDGSTSNKRHFSSQVTSRITSSNACRKVSFAKINSGISSLVNDADLQHVIHIASPNITPSPSASHQTLFQDIKEQYVSTNCNFAVNPLQILFALHPCGQAIGECGGEAIQAAWEGPFGPCLPPTSAGEADPFHADWPYW